MKTYTAQQIADFFLSVVDPQDSDVSNLKLQKLCYYAQGLCTSMRGSPLFLDPIEAWDHGPVVPNLYHTYKNYRAEVLPAKGDFDVEQIDEADRKALLDIYSYYGQFSAWRLRNMTHEEKPWIEAYRSGNREISVSALLEFFDPQVDEEYKTSTYH